MTRAQLDAMSERELDVLVAEKIMDIRIIKPPFIPSEVDTTDAVFIDIAADIWRATYKHGRAPKTISHYSTDLNAARMVLEKVGEKEVQHEFMMQLSSIVWPESRCTTEFRGVSRFTFDFLLATPRQLMTAALLAWMEGGDAK